ncbi:hypothetical protein ACFZAV_39815 [Streptomyces sp. NPDC008343]|uniref:hypothetical protein n=1 Tax=Streptomyces sp. NPDC008343 TaxID=3364828 RepID=UPI0036E22EF8
MLIFTVASATAAVAAVYELIKYARRGRAERDTLARLRIVVDEDITALGEEIGRLDFWPGEAGSDAAMFADYEHALNAYDDARALLAAAKHLEDVRAVILVLKAGYFAIADLAARRSGQPLPVRRVFCFFDPRHGPSVDEIIWQPLRDSGHKIPVCADDRDRIADGQDPQIREVQTELGARPYWNAGHTYMLWASSYFGTGLLSGLLAGKVLGSVAATECHFREDETRHAPMHSLGFYGDGGDGYRGGDLPGTSYDWVDFSDDCFAPGRMDC